MYRVLITLYIIAFISACTTTNDAGPDSDESADSVVVADTVSTVPKTTSPVAAEQKAYKAEIDSMVKYRRIFVQTFAKVRGGDVLVEVFSEEDWPEEATIESVYNLSYRPNGSTLFFAEKLYNLDDKRVQFTHYFNDRNKTVGFEKYVVYYTNSCDDGSAVETEIKYYDSDFNVLENRYSLLDDDDKEMPGLECIRDVVIPFSVYSSYEELARVKKTKVMELQ